MLLFVLLVSSNTVAAVPGDDGCALNPEFCFDDGGIPPVNGYIDSGFTVLVSYNSSTFGTYKLYVPTNAGTIELSSASNYKLYDDYNHKMYHDVAYMLNYDGENFSGSNLLMFSLKSGYTVSDFTSITNYDLYDKDDETPQDSYFVAAEINAHYTSSVSFSSGPNVSPVRAFEITSDYSAKSYILTFGTSSSFGRYIISSVDLNGDFTDNKILSVTSSALEGTYKVNITTNYASYINLPYTSSSTTIPGITILDLTE